MQSSVWPARHTGGLGLAASGAPIGCGVIPAPPIMPPEPPIAVPPAMVEPDIDPDAVEPDMVEPVVPEPDMVEPVVVEPVVVEPDAVPMSDCPDV